MILNRAVYFAWILLVSLTSTVAGATFSNQRVTTSAPSNSGCTIPPSVSTFPTTDNTVYLYFEGVVGTGDYLTNDWIAPDGTNLSGGGWNPVSGNYCFTGASLTITGTSSNRLGNWQGRVLDNGAVVVSVSFTVTGNANSTPTSPSSPTSTTATTSRRTLPVDPNGAAYSLSNDPFYEGGAWECTRYAWGRALEKTGVRLQFRNGPPNASSWYSTVVQQSGITLGSTARPNSIAVWTGGSGGLGHVAYVEDINADGSLVVTEANYPVNSLPVQHILSPSSTSGYQINSRDGGAGTNLILAGFIYLTSYEGYLDVSTNNCSSSVIGWVTDRQNTNTPLEVDIFDGEKYLGSSYANGWRQDVATYLGNSGFNGFVYQLSSSLHDGQNHEIWVRVDQVYTDLAHFQSVSCKATSGNLKLTFSPSYVTGPQATSSCSASFSFTLSGTETSGLGINLSQMTVSPEGYSWSLPALGVPGRINPSGAFSSSLSWCRGPGISTFTITGTDDGGNAVMASGAVTFALQ